MKKISNSALNTYNTCHRKYDLHYNKRLRSNVISGALIMGGAIDKAQNELLTSRNLESSIKTFDEEFTNAWVNNKKQYIPDATNVVYAKKDFDVDLLTFEDEKQFGQKFLELTEKDHCDGIEKEYAKLLEVKETSGFENLPNEAKELYNLANWLCLRRKGHILLKGYNDEVLPKIKSVIANQKEFNITGKTGDTINGFIDLICEFQDGKKYVIDNKTSYWEYEPDSPSKSQQLIIYNYVANKEGLKLDGAGFIVSYKQIQKNRVKICSKCNYNGTGERYKTCPQDSAGVRCMGEWKETIRPTAKIDIILNTIPITAQNLVIQTFQGAVDGIKKEHFGPNLDSCEKFGQKCQFYNRCWKGEDKNLIQLELKDDKK